MNTPNNKQLAKEEQFKEDEHHERLVRYLNAMTVLSVLMLLLVVVAIVFSFLNPDVANVFKELFTNPFS